MDEPNASGVYFIFVVGQRATIDIMKYQFDIYSTLIKA